jgi:ribokinase
VTKVLNIGSLNIDYVYSVPHLVRPGETIICKDYRQFCGGKGLNQSVALALAGSETFHAGRIGSEGSFLKERLKAAGVNTDYIETIPDEVNGHTIIQVDENGQNSITLYGGANQKFSKADVAKILSTFSAGDYLLLQNEVNQIPEMIHQARQKDMIVFYNPAPVNDSVSTYPLQDVDYFVINETEGMGLTGKTEPDEIIVEMRRKFPRAAAILTLGENGVIFSDSDQAINMPAEKVKPVDTTAAGDTFIGFFIAQKIRGNTIENCLRIATRAAAICVTRRGAADSIPLKEEVVYDE